MGMLAKTSHFMFFHTKWLITVFVKDFGSFCRRNSNVKIEKYSILPYKIILILHNKEILLHINNKSLMLVWVHIELTNVDFQVREFNEVTPPEVIRNSLPSEAEK